jgi:DNA-binding FadR family transcriptional regulator
VVSVQLLIEGAVAAELASTTNATAVLELRQIVDDMDDASLSNDELLELELRLHQVLAEHSGNAVVAAILSGLLPAIRSYLRSGAELTNDSISMAKWFHVENRSIVDAIEQGDVVGASIGMRDHVAHCYARL